MKNIIFNPLGFHRCKTHHCFMSCSRKKENCIWISPETNWHFEKCLSAFLAGINKFSASGGMLTCDRKFFAYISVLKYNIIYLQTSFFSVPIFEFIPYLRILALWSFFLQGIFSVQFPCLSAYTVNFAPHIKCISFCCVSVPFSFQLNLFKCWIVAKIWKRLTAVKFSTVIAVVL